MPDVALDLSRVVFAKTAVGQQEIQTRSLGLGPLPRRLLVLIDGKRSGQELATFVAGHDVNELLDQLREKACIESVAPIQPAPVAVTNLKSHSTDDAASNQTVATALAGLPAPETRNAEDIEKARSFMVNTVNYVFGQNTRMVMLEAIFECQTAQALRLIYPKWVELMSSNKDGIKRLPELQLQLLKVL